MVLPGKRFSGPGLQRDQTLLNDASNMASKWMLLKESCLTNQVTAIFIHMQLPPTTATSMLRSTHRPVQLLTLTLVLLQ